MYDFVIVGAGSAGCVLANRLSAGGHTVALLEVGPAANRRWRVRAPAEQLDLWRSSLDWGFATEPQPHADHREVYWPRGKLLGGSSCLNGMELRVPGDLARGLASGATARLWHRSRS